MFKKQHVYTDLNVLFYDYIFILIFLGCRRWEVLYYFIVL